MPNTPYHTPEDALRAHAPEHLSGAERRALWSSVSGRIAGIPSPYAPSFFTSHAMIPLALIIAVLLSAGGTVAAADAARPGDLLFPVDRAVEDLRLRLSSEGDKDDLRIKFANERLDEFSSIVSDEFGDDLPDAELTEAEADIFTNETIVKLEAGDRKALFSTSADTREEIIAAIESRYGFSKEAIDAVLVVETEDRASTAQDGDESSADARLRVEHALDVLNGFVLATRGSASTSPGVLNALNVLEAHLLERSTSLPEDLRVRIKDDRARFEFEDENGRTRVEFKDGEVRVKTDDDDREDDDSRSGSYDDSSSALQIEADVFTDTTLVKVERNDDTDTFSTDATSREDIIDEILAKYSDLSRSEVEAALDLEVEDRASRPDDTSSDDSDDDEDKDDDSSGKGSGNSGHGGRD